MFFKQIKGNPCVLILGDTERNKTVRQSLERLSTGTETNNLFEIIDNDYVFVTNRTTKAQGIKNLFICSVSPLSTWKKVSESQIPSFPQTLF